jgi:GntR family transcriptional regulator/MocR family aminotransferase
MRCSLEQVIVLSSAQEALELATRALLDPGDPAWLEDPSWLGARGALTIAEVRIVPVPVDGDGLMVEHGIAAEPDARLAYVSPSHQYPIGVMLSLERRLTLLHWAARSGAWILEDDYDSEYRYAGYPLTALAGLDAAARVLYVGTFNKTMFPSLRLGYLVVPESLIEAFVAVRVIGVQHAPRIEQAILADFIAEGHYERHLRHTRAVCRERRDGLIAAANRELPGLLEFAQMETGLHTVGWLAPNVDDEAIAVAAGREGCGSEPCLPLLHWPLPKGRPRARICRLPAARD